MATVIGDFGSGTGWIYITQLDGTTVINNVQNDSFGRESIKSAAATGASTTSSTTSYDATFRMTGNRYFLSSNALAVEGVIYAPDNIEITSYLVGDRAKTVYTSQATIAAGAVTINRYSSNMVLTVDTEGGAGTDFLDTITMLGVIQGDTLTINGINSGHVVTLLDNTGNIQLAGALPFSTGDVTERIVLTWNSLGGGVPAWFEVSRSASLLFPNIANLRLQAVPVPIAGATSTALTGANITVTLTPGTSKGYQIFTGNAALGGNIDIVFDAAGGKDGDTFIVDYRATMTVGVFALTIGNVALTAKQALEGNVIVTGIWSAATGTWYSRVIRITNGTNLLTETLAASTYEPVLGNSAANGYILSTTAAGVRSWIAVPNSILYNTTGNNGTTAIITEEFLKTYAMSGSTLDTDGDVLYCKTIYQTAANANAKTETFYFGATAVVTITGNFNASTIIVEGTITRTGAATQVASFKATQYAIAGGAWVSEVASYTTPAETLSGAINIRAASTNGVASANDSINRTMFIQKMDK